MVRNRAFVIYGAEAWTLRAVTINALIWIEDDYENLCSNASERGMEDLINREINYILN